MAKVEKTIYLVLALVVISWGLNVVMVRAWFINQRKRILLNWANPIE